MSERQRSINALLEFMHDSLLARGGLLADLARKGVFRKLIDSGLFADLYESGTLDALIEAVEDKSFGTFVKEGGLKDLLGKENFKKLVSTGILADLVSIGFTEVKRRLSPKKKQTKKTTRNDQYRPQPLLNTKAILK